MAISSPGWQGTPAYMDEGFEGSPDSRGSKGIGKGAVCALSQWEGNNSSSKTSICSIPLGKANKTRKPEAVSLRTGKTDICYLYLFKDWASLCSLDNLKLMAILLPQPLGCCDYRGELPPLALLI